MSNKSTEYNDKVFQYDLDAYGISVKDKDFKESNIFSNRIMSNAYLFDKQIYGIIGFILKEVAEDGLNIQQRDPKAVSEYLKQSLKIVGSIITMLKQNEVSIEELWNMYSEQQLSTHSMFMSKNERAAYPKLEKDFSTNIIKKLLEILEENKPFLFDKRNNFLKGILNEIGRVSKTHGLTRNDEHFVSLLRMLHRVDEYVKASSSNLEFIKRSKEEILPFVDEILLLYKSISDENPKEKEIDLLLWKIIGVWRLSFIKYLDLGTTAYSIREEKTQSDEEEESELIGEVKKHIEDKMGI